MQLAFNHNCAFTCALHNKNSSFRAVNEKMLSFCNNNNNKAIFMKNSIIFFPQYIGKIHFLQVTHHLRPLLRERVTK